MEPDSFGPYAEHAPQIYDDNCDDNGIKHRLSADASPALDRPKGVDAERLRQDTGHEEISELNGVVCLDLILKGLDDGDRGVETVS